MRMTRFIFCLVLSACCIAGMVSCSSSPKPVPEKTDVMPTEYPKTAAQTLQVLQPHIPQNTEALMVTSYGSFADTIEQFKQWNLVDAKDLNNALRDLDLHYQLNPTKLADYYKAGMNTASGFAIGYFDKNFYILFDVYHTAKFKSWLDNFMNEEFGRPRYQEQTVGNKTISEIHILDRDFATLVYEENKPAILVLGEGLIAKSPSSRECAEKLLETAGISKSQTESIAQMLTNAPIGAWFKGGSHLFDAVPEKYAAYKDLLSDAIVEANLTNKGPQVHLRGKWKTGTSSEIQPATLAALAKGSNGGWGDAIMQGSPSSAARILFDAQKLEEIILPTLNDKTRASYLDIKQKLTQKLLKIDISDQIIYNIGSAWISLYDAQIPNVQSPSLEDILFAQNGVVYLPMKEKEKSDAFFAKLSILKRVIPEDKAQIDTENGILHAIVNLGAGKKLHAGYTKGLLAITTANGWEKAAGTLKAENAPSSPSLLAQEKHFIATHIAKEDITRLLGTRYGIVKEQLSNFLAPLSHAELQASVNETQADATLALVMSNE